MKSLEKFIKKKIKSLKDAAEESKKLHAGTREDISWFALERAKTLEWILKEWDEEQAFQRICDNWHEHDDIDPSTGEYYSKPHQLRVMGKSNRP